MKTKFIAAFVFAGIVFTAFSACADALIDSWFITFSAKHARVFTNDAAKTAGNAVATWNNGTQNQSLPAYAGVQEIYSSSNWVYLRISGLGVHTMTNARWSLS